MAIYGIDVHPQFQAGLNIEQVRAEGFDFMAVKVSESTDTYPGQDWLRRGKACGLLPIGYHYLRPGNEVEQAHVFAAQLLAVDAPGMLDAEAPGLTVRGLHAFLDAAAYQGARIPLLYLPHWFWADHMGSPDLSGLPSLWASSYVGGSGYASTLYESVTPRYWASYGGLPVTILQFTDKALVAGQRIDADVFNGTRDELTAILGSHTPPPIPPPVPAGGNTIPPMAYGETSDTIRKLQAWLNEMFFYAHISPVSGYYGDQTTAALREFQHREGILDGDGRNIGPRTATALAGMGFRP